MKSIKGLLFSSAPLALIAAWQYYGSDGALNIALVIVWFIHFPAGMLMVVSDKLQRELALEKATPIMVYRLHWLFRLGTLFALAWFGFMWTCAAYALALLCIAAGHDKIRALRAAAS